MVDKASCLCQHPNIGTFADQERERKMSKTNKTSNQATETPKRKVVPLADKLAQLSAMAESDETVAALQPAIESAMNGVDEAKVILKRAKRRLRKLVQAAFSGTED
jgi:hypothetical protein